MGFLKKGIRILAEAAALCLLLTALPAPVQAQEAQTGQDSRTVLTTKVDGHPDTVEKGSGEVTLDDGTAVTVEGDSLPDGLLFVVEHIRKCGILQAYVGTTIIHGRSECISEKS